MEVKVLKQEKDSLLVELKGDTIGFANLLREELWESKDVDEAASIKEHPYMSEPKVYVKTKGASPKKVLLDAAKSLQNKVKELENEFKMNIKK
ncbi:MAG: DNA-directed RNA polymerase subunit L [Candidatus Aenigmarchaeota archaeon]|nr:DNA-directed RNA polymerase subunit L [Candidatus Aenigmarchaeota archaeon]